jgi:hypothetical protein
VAYRIVSPIEDEGVAAVSEILSVANGTNRTPYEYRSDVRDPFFFGKLKPRRFVHLDAMRVVKPELPPAPFRLTGIMTRTKRNTAVLEGSGGSVYFLAEGDTISGIRILKVKAQEVTYLFRKKQLTWSLQ